MLVLLVKGHADFTENVYIYSLIPMYSLCCVDTYTQVIDTRVKRFIHYFFYICTQNIQRETYMEVLNTESSQNGSHYQRSN